MPQTRGDLTPKQSDRLAAAMKGVEDAEIERELAVADALKGGASIRAVSEFTGLSTTTVQKYGHKHGWPTATQRQKWADEAASRDEWRRHIYGPDQ